MLIATNLCKTYAGKHVLQHVNLSMQAGEVIGLLGPNGAGKTMLFYSLIGQIHPDQGQVRYADQDITAMPMHQRARLGIGYLPQDNAIFRQLSIEDNIMAVLELRPELSNEQRQLKQSELLAAFSLEGIRSTLGARASGGERRRAEIARAMALEPTFMLLDEPFAGIDPVSIHAIRATIRQLAQAGIGVLITDHNVSETLSICDRAYLLYQGQVLCEGTPDTLTRHPQAQQVYFGENFQW